MERLLALREVSGLSQFTVARKSDVSRMRLSLAETGQLTLSDEEEARIRAVLLIAIEARSLRLRAVLADSRTEAEISG
jgi:transcriptional regulator with XRE-family HTH domain